MEGSYVTTFYDFFGYLVDNFRKPDCRKRPTRCSEKASIRRPRLDSVTESSSILSDFLLWAQSFPLVCWNTLKSMLYVFCILPSCDKRHDQPRLFSGCAHASKGCIGTITSSFVSHCPVGTG